MHFSRSGAGRFDAPAGEYGVLYVAEDVHCAFIETFGRLLGDQVVALDELAVRQIARLEVRRQLRVVDLSGPGLRRLGADARLSTGDYRIAQRWALALWQHPSHPDGLYWRSRFDPSRACVAVFDRAGDAISCHPVGSLADPALTALLAEILNTYDFGLV